MLYNNNNIKPPIPDQQYFKHHGDNKQITAQQLREKYTDVNRNVKKKRDKGKGKGKGKEKTKLRIYNIT